MDIPEFEMRRERELRFTEIGQMRVDSMPSMGLLPFNVAYWEDQVRKAKTESDVATAGIVIAVEPVARFRRMAAV
jgi:hypothetical protein